MVPLSKLLLLTAALITGDKLNLNLSHVDEGFHVIAKPEAPSNVVIYGVMIRAGFPDFNPNGIDCFVILSDRGQDPLLHQLTVDIQQRFLKRREVVKIKQTVLSDRHTRLQLITGKDGVLSPHIRDLPNVDQVVGTRLLRAFMPKPKNGSFERLQHA
ncbi:hypothetical protein KY290_003597 [Solanum tuberosum]|uniref:Uncharacterized protein n=1 Tax=Solanum tuberosum TaxID=4113 RepID=A0ABQ7WTC2_SOLTU|nr:hypothetical protein KY290_003597 [Solanum tuberosum]